MEKNLSHLVFFLLILISASVVAEDSDFDYPITLEADEAEVDFSTGQRIYHGNVVLKQGGFRLQCDQLETFDDDEGVLSSATCMGNLAEFKQRPKGAESDIVGVAREIDMNHGSQVLTLKNQARIMQDDKTLSGTVIKYDIDNGRVRVLGSKQERVSETVKSSDKSHSKTGRPSLVIQSRKNKKAENE